MVKFVWFVGDIKHKLIAKYKHKFIAKWNCVFRDIL